jgi:hypothetical protein
MGVRYFPHFRYFVIWCKYTDFSLDISGRNIAFSCTHLSNATEEELFDVLGSPEIEPLARVDGAPLENGLPTQVIGAADWVEWIDEDDEEIRLLDIGESFFQGQEPKTLAQPSTLKVPETIFMDRFDFRVDLWRTGCMVRQKFSFCGEKLTGKMNSRFIFSSLQRILFGILARKKF